MNWSIFSAILGPLLGAAAVLYVGIQSRRAAEKTNTVEQVRADAEAYGEARRTWLAQIDELRTQIRELAGRILALERERDAQRRRMLALIEYVKALRSLLRLHNIENVPPPPPDVFLEESA